jgi:hypothetical protein
MDNEPTEDNKTEDNKKPVSLTLTSEDIKLLVITFAGTVAGNVFTVAVVGLAIVTARFFNVTRTPLTLTILVVITICGIAMPVIVIVALSSQRRREELEGLPGQPKKVFIAFSTFGTCFFLFSALIWVGIAAGIK